MILKLTILLMMEHIFSTQAMNGSWVPSIPGNLECVAVYLLYTLFIKRKFWTQNIGELLMISQLFCHFSAVW